MNTVLRGSLIQRPKSIPHPTLMPRKERMWHAEHFGNVSETKGKIAAAKRTGEAVSEAASSDEAKVAGTIAKDTGKELLRIAIEIIKILASSSGGIAIFSGIILILEKKLNPEQLFKTTRIIFFVTLGISFGGAILTHLMNLATQTANTKEFQEAGETVNDATKSAEAEAAVQAALAEDTIENTTVEDTTEAVSTTTEDVVS